MKPIGIITGLDRESACFTKVHRNTPTLIRCAAANSDRAKEIAINLAKQGVSGLVSFGLAGGLQTELKPGQLILADCIIDDVGSRFYTSDDWRRSVVAALERGHRSVKVGPIAGVRRVVSDPNAKIGLGKQTGALAIDMESAAIAAVAEQYKLPFLVFRAVADPAWREIPPWVLGYLDHEGQLNIGALVGQALIHPRDWLTLAALAWNEQKALQSLRRALVHTDQSLGLQATLDPDIAGS